MKTPISSFLDKYANEKNVRLHMPAHKGRGGDIEKYDITEISGADSLFEADGIIMESEKNAGSIFGADTFYSTEGSSLSIRAMAYLVTLFARAEGKTPLIAAARNAHKSFISAAALLDFDIDWLTDESPSYLSCRLSFRDVENYLKGAKRLPTAVYLTSPDYLGYTADIEGIARVCHKAGVLLIVDNAHGAYLKFLTPSLHPIDLGADMCCDSAHKTLGVLTGAAYLHVSKNAPPFFKENARGALSLFASTSPSYLILRSLDEENPYLLENYRRELSEFIPKLYALKRELSSHGYTLADCEPMKITVIAKDYGYTGDELSKILSERGIYAEFSDPDYLVLMPSPKNTDADLHALRSTLFSIPKREKIDTAAPSFSLPKRAMSIREAVLSNQEVLPISKALGKTLAQVTVGCPPAVPIVVSGEILDEKAIEAFKYYNIKAFSVVK